MDDCSTVEWRDIPGYEGLYRISQDGHVYSLVHEREIIPFLHHTGYLRVTLMKPNGRRTPREIHRLLALAFLGLATKHLHVHHKNENKLDNSLDNLEYLTHSRHMSYHNRQRAAVGGASILVKAVKEILQASNKAIRTVDIRLDVDRLYPGVFKKSHVLSALSRLAASGEINRVRQGWYEYNRDEGASKVREKYIQTRKYVLLGATVTNEQGMTVDNLAKAAKKTRSQVVRDLLDFALTHR